MLHTLGNATPPDDDRAPDLVRRLVDRLLSAEGSGEPPRDLGRAIADWVIYLAVYRDDAWAWELIERLAAVPEHHNELLSQFVFYAINVITPRNVDDPRRREAVIRARDWLVTLIREFARAVRPVAAGSVEASATASPHQGRIAAMFRLVDEVVSRAYLNGQRGERSGSRGGAGDLPTSAARANYYRLIEPLLHAVLAFSGREGANHMVARTAHYFMQLLNETLVFDPAGVLQMAAEVAAAAVGGGYQFDSLAVQEVVRLVEVVLTDHRDLLLQEQPLAAALRLLDVFADAGWPEALRLVWRLDEAFR
jgi:hypothetical protein